MQITCKRGKKYTPDTQARNTHRHTHRKRRRATRWGGRADSVCAAGSKRRALYEAVGFPAGTSVRHEIWRVFPADVELPLPQAYRLAQAWGRLEARRYPDVRALIRANAAQVLEPQELPAADLGEKFFEVMSCDGIDAYASRLPRGDAYGAGCMSAAKNSSCLL